MLVGEMNVGLEYGILVIADIEDIGELPPWESADDQVTTSRSSIVMRALHRQEGEVRVRAWLGGDDGSGSLVFAGEIDVPTGTICISDVTKANWLNIEVEAGRRTISIFADSSVEASEVGVVVDPT